MIQREPGIDLAQSVHRVSGPASTRWRVARPGLWLFLLGLCFVPIWPTDILHFYDVYFLLATPLLTRSDRWLQIAMLGLILAACRT